MAVNTKITCAEVAETIKIDSSKDPIKILVAPQLLSLKKKSNFMSSLYE